MSRLLSALQIVLPVLLLLHGHGVKFASGQSALRLSIDGTIRDNNSIIVVTDLGTDFGNPLVDALQCNTDHRPCCRVFGTQPGDPGITEGEWHYPNGTRVRAGNEPQLSTDFVRTRGQADGTVNLFRRGTEITNPIGSFCCETLVDAGVNGTICANIVPPGFSISISDGGATPFLGQSYSLTCSVSGGSATAYQWSKDGAVLSGETAAALSFSPLELSDGAMYTCEASGTPFTVVRQNQSVILQIPASVRVTSDQTNPLAVRPIGSATVTLTCTVELSLSVDVPVTVNTVWTGPDNFNRNIMTQQMGSTTTYTSTVMVSSFGRDQSGNYRCTATVSPNDANPFLTDSMSSGTARVTVGVYLRQNGMFLANNSAVFISDIGSATNDRIQCITDRMPCCATSRDGEWYFPPGDGGMTVPTIGSGANMATTFYRNRENDGTVNLNRLSNNVMMPTGQYCCVVPDATGVMQSACVRIFDVQITDSDEATPTAGESYSLTCGTSGVSGFSYQWSRSDDAVRPLSTAVALSFSPLRLSDADQYTCQATLNSRQFTDDFVVNVQVPSPSSVTVSSEPDFFDTAGVNVTVICRVELGPNVTDGETSLIAVNARLTHNGTIEVPLVGSSRDGTTYSFTAVIPSFQPINDGEYVCAASVTPAAENILGNGTLMGMSTLGIGVRPTGGPQGGDNTAGIAVGVVLVILAVVAAVVTALLVVYFVRRRNRIVKNYKATYVPPPVSYTKIDDTDGVSATAHRRGGAPNVEEFPTDASVTEGEGVYFRIRVGGVPQPTVTWYHNGEPVKADYAREIEADGSLAIPSTELKHSGVYKAVVANQHGTEEREVKLTVNDEGGAITSPLAAASDGKVYTKPVSISEFGKYVSDLHANSNQPFKDLYQALDTGEDGHTTSYAVSGGRKPLNRFGNIVVYDDNRIPLQPIPDVQGCQGDYVNACYVDGYGLPNKFIATQGPLPKTVADFWRLIWQERPPTIVMITNIKEGNRIKCQQYWPESGKKDFGPFQVTIADQQENADYVIRTLSVSLSGSGRSHKVTQYHFTAWPDHGVPDYATPILAFYRRVKSQHHPSRGPMVVHCSAGVGRTGTFIVIDHILEQIEKEQVVDIPGAITKIRQKRMKMVQTHDQFMFIHDAILESVTCGDTQIAATDLRINVAKMKKRDNQNQPKGFNYQFKILEQVSPNPEEVLSTTALSYPDKNRNDSFLPADRWRVVLKGEQPDYIHAVSINGYKHKRAFIIAQGPMGSTVRNFWKMIYDRKCAVVVMVSGLVEEGQEASAQYWPDNVMGQFGEFIVDKLGEEPLEGFTIRNLSVMDKRTQKAHQVTQFHVTCWSRDGRCSNLKSITDVIEEMTKVQIRSGNKPIVVHCNDTVTRSGMFCAIATTIERCKTEGVVDVFQVVKALRVQKPGAVPNVDNYKQVFEAVLVYLESFDTYANFS